MVRIAEFKGLSFITLRLSYNSIAIELNSVPMLFKFCRTSLGMVIHHFLPKSVVHDPNLAISVIRPRRASKPVLIDSPCPI